MTLSAFDLFSIGIGPSSSHTVGPMRAAAQFAQDLRMRGVLAAVRRVKVELFGSLGATGRGHGSDNAVLLGLEGEDPETVDVAACAARITAIRAGASLMLSGTHQITFKIDNDLVLHARRSMPQHPNTMTMIAFDGNDDELVQRTFLSVGGGFIVDADAQFPPEETNSTLPVRFPFTSARDLLDLCRSQNMSISDLVMANETDLRSHDAVLKGLLHLWDVMQDCVRNGVSNADGVLPGGLHVPRRAPALHAKLTQAGHTDPLNQMEWINLYALAVNEENAAGGRIVTAPTNGAAGIIPAVLHYYTSFVPGADREGVVRFLLAATAIGSLFKLNASISGAEVGCQGEVGSACAMAAAGLCEVLGGTPEQVENAAEIGIEHHLGLTCDPIGGLVQIPCIERNAIASVKAVNAARLALYGDGNHKVSLDAAIRTMKETGRDMSAKYKETSRGGLAVNVVEC